MSNIYMKILVFFVILFNLACGTKKVATELAELQGKWEGPIKPGPMGSGTFYFKRLLFEEDKFTEATVVCLSMNPPKNLNDCKQVASIVEKSKITPLLSSNQNIPELEMLILDSHLNIFFDKNKPDEFWRGNVTYRLVVDDLLKIFGKNTNAQILDPDWVPVELQGDKNFAQMNFDGFNQAKMDYKKGIKQKIGYEFLKNKDEFIKYFFKNGKPEKDILGDPFKKIE